MAKFYLEKVTIRCSIDITFCSANYNAIFSFSSFFFNKNVSIEIVDLEVEHDPLDKSFPISKSCRYSYESI